MISNELKNLIDETNNQGKISFVDGATDEEIS